MQPFKTLNSCVIPLPRNNVDTDQIIPASYLKGIDKTGLAEGLFFKWRYLSDGSPDPDFPLNQSRFQGCQVLLAGDNFGNGSSREHAPWALTGWGLRVVISTSFADIFRNNALKNSLLPLIVDEQTHCKLFQMASGMSPTQVTVELATQQLHLPDGSSVSFPIDPFSKLCLLEGVDQLGYLLKQTERIAAYEQQHGLVSTKEARDE
jgi:3-isopropylmalate/(R)-2-methylmalate dehydratase small subunit